MVVAALYVRSDGPYAGMDQVDAWDAARDARLFSGPGPVVAHPPCGAWGRYWRWYKGTDADCGPRAVEQVRRYGGILEHPADSKLFARTRMPAPGSPRRDVWGGYTVEVFQSDWGHRALKRTWLYFVGCKPLPTPSRQRTPQSEVELMGKRERELTPPLLAAWLVGSARNR